LYPFPPTVWTLRGLCELSGILRSHVHITVHKLTSLSYCQAILRRRKVQSFRSDVVSAASGRVVFAVWHADAAGIYCDEWFENTTGQTFLRGYRITDSSGAVTIKPLCPAGTADASFTFTSWFEHSLGPARCSPNSPRDFFFEHTLTTLVSSHRLTLCRAPATRRTASIPARRG